MKKIVLNGERRAFIEIEIEINGVVYKLKYQERIGKQLKEARKLAKKVDASMVDVLELNEKHFFDNLTAEDEVKTKEAQKLLISFYDENGDIQDFISECEIALNVKKSKK